MNKHMFLVIFNFFLILFIILPVTGSPIEDFAHYLGGERNITILKDRWISFSATSYSQDSGWTVTPGTTSSFSSRAECSESGRKNIEEANNRDDKANGFEHKYLCGKNCKYDATGITCDLLCGGSKCQENQGPTFHFSTLRGYW